MRDGVMIASCIVLGLFALGGLAGASDYGVTAADIKAAVNYLMSAVAISGMAIVLAIYFSRSERKAGDKRQTTEVVPAPPPDPAVVARRAAANRRALLWGIAAVGALVVAGVGYRVLEPVLNPAPVESTSEYWRCTSRGDAKIADWTQVRERCKADTDAWE